MSKKGYVRLVNIKGHPDIMAEPDEKIIVMDRTNRIFGNPHVMRGSSMAERMRVISLFKKDLDDDVEKKGPMWQAMNEIALDVVNNGAKIACACHCRPLPCHVESIIDKIQEIIIGISPIQKIGIRKNRP